MNCDRQCYEIGGPWIAEDPNCPIHGHEAQRRDEDRREEERTRELELVEMKEDIATLKAQIESLQHTVKELRRKVNWA